MYAQRAWLIVGHQRDQLAAGNQRRYRMHRLQGNTRASAPTVKAIKASMQGKLAYWSPILKDNAPEKLVLPDVLEGDHLTLEGQPLEIKGLTGPAPERSYVWIPSLKAVVGGVVVSSGIHVWVADTQSPKSRQDWLATLKGIEALKPASVIPGHYLEQIPQGTQLLPSPPIT